MKIQRSSVYAVAIALGLLASNVYAIPTLQLGIAGGVYDASEDEETVFAQSDSFSLYAYLIPDAKNTLGDTYRLSAAVVPKTGPVNEDLGSFTIDTGNGPQTVKVTSDMTYGTPPVETFDDLQVHDGGDLGPHGIFDTFFIEIQFTFDEANKSAQFNVQDQPGQGPISGTGMYYKEFKIDVSNLLSEAAIHFDLYNVAICTVEHGKCNKVGDIDQTQFAPFSKDAQSGPGGYDPETEGDNQPPGQTVPEPGILSLLAAGLLGMSAKMKRKQV